MTYVPDLAAFTVAFGGRLEDGLTAVGWLAGDQPFSGGPVSSEFVDALRDLCRKGIRRTRGFHQCELCAARSDELLSVTSIRSPRGDYLVGAAEIRVAGEAWRYAAPDMIIHYVEAHAYQPPAEFITAVVQTAASG